MHRDRSEVVYVPLDGDPEAVADALMEDERPDRLLDEVPLREPPDAPQLLMYLVHRTRYFNIDREEVVRFAERNRTALEGWGLKVLDRAASAVRAEDAPFARELELLAEDVRRALAGRADEIRRASPRVQWLVIALAMQVQGAKLTHSAASDLLRRPPHCARLDRPTLEHMLFDFSDNRDAAFGPKTEYVMLIAEGALEIKDLGSASAALFALSLLHPASDLASWADVVRRCTSALTAAGRMTDDHRAFADRVERRVADTVSDDDL
jgi:hypothetical protein